MKSRSRARGLWVLLAIVGALFLFSSGLFLVYWTAAPADGMAMLGGGRIAVLPLRGVITGNHALIRHLREYRRDRSIRGLVVHIDSPGGEVAPSQVIFEGLRSAREDGLPVVAVIDAVGASGAYYAALGADTILAMPGSLIGSIGVIMEYPNIRELLERAGVRYEVVKSGRHKDVGSPFRDPTSEDRMILQDVVDDVYEQFVEAISESRGLPRDSVVKVADGRLLSGRQAAAYGLVDREGDLSTGLEIAGEMAGLGPEPRTVTPQERRRANWLDLLIGSSGQVAGDILDPVAAVDVLLERWIRSGPRLLFMLSTSRAEQSVITRN